MMADSEYNLLALLKAHYPLVPITTVINVMNKYENDQQKCRQALESEVGKRLNAPDSELSAPASSSNNNNNNKKNLESPEEGKSVMARIKELQVCHEGSWQSKTSNVERHVSTVERAVGNAPRPPEQSKKPYVNQSMSWAVQTSDKPLAGGTQIPTSRTHPSSTTTPLDFSSFFNRSATDIPNINCRTSGLGSGLNEPTTRGSRPQQIPLNFVSASNSPVEQRRPVKVINIPPGSLSGGLVSSAATPSNPRQIHMNFGDTGGICTISTPPTMQRYGSTPNISQNYKSEIRTEAPTLQPVHSSSIVVNTSSHITNQAPERKLNTSISVNDFSGSGRRTSNPLLLVNHTDHLGPGRKLNTSFSAIDLSGNGRRSPNPSDNTPTHTNHLTQDYSGNGRRSPNPNIVNTQSHVNHLAPERRQITSANDSSGNGRRSPNPPLLENTQSHVNYLTPGRRKNTNSNDSAGNGRCSPNPNIASSQSHVNHSTPSSERRLPNLPLSLNTDDYLSNSGPNISYASDKLSTPIQASSPGISHSKPDFVEMKTDRLSAAQIHGGYNGTNYASGFNPGVGIRPPSLNPNILSQQNMPFIAFNNPMIYNTQFNQDFSNTPSFPIRHPQMEFPYHPQQQKPPGFHSPPSNFGQHPTGFRPSFYPPFSTATSLMGYSLMPGHFPGQTPRHLSQFPHFSPNSSHSSSPNLPKSPMTGSSRSSSQDSEHGLGMDYDGRSPFYNAMSSHVSSHSSVSSDTSSGHGDGVDSSTRPRSGSIQDEAEYVRALTQHQRRQMQKLMEEMNRHRLILNKLHSEVSTMEKNMIETNHLSRNFPSVEDISGLCESNRRLQTDIQLYMNEIDMYKSGQTPFNKINPLDQQNFFENMPTGQQDPIYSRTSDGIISPSPRSIPPPRPPPPIPVRQRSTEISQASGGAASSSNIFCVLPVPSAQPIIGSGDSEEGESWNCSACTFSNHPALKKCEMCEMPRVINPHPTTSLGPPPVALLQSMSSVPPRLGPGSGLVSSMHPRSGSPHSTPGHHHHPGSGT